MKTRKVYVFFTRTEKWVSRFICKVTKSEWSHCGIGFMTDTGTKIYFEALAGKGFKGNKLMSDLVAWQAEVPKGRKLAIMELPDLQPYGDMMLGACKAYEEVVTYSELQLVVGHWLLAKFGRQLRSTSDKVICSEMVSRVIALGGTLLLDMEHRNHDSVTPHSAMHNIKTKFNYKYDYLAG